MNKRLRVLALTVFTAGVLMATLSTARAGLYRYLDENGTVHFTDDIHKVPENQRPAVIPEEQKPESASPPVPAPADNNLQAPRAPDDKKASASDKLDALFVEKEILDAEFMEIIEERDRLERERSLPGGPTEVQIYNEAVFRLKDRIAAYLKRCKEYEAGLKNYNETAESLENKMEKAIQSGSKSAPGPPGK